MSDIIDRWTPERLYRFPDRKPRDFAIRHIVVTTLPTTSQVLVSAPREAGTAPGRLDFHSAEIVISVEFALTDRKAAEAIVEAYLSGERDGMVKGRDAEANRIGKMIRDLLRVAGIEAAVKITG